MNGRVYDPFTGRFLSADVMVEDPYNGQTYSRYSYVLNNPTNLVDPTGFNSDCPGKDSGDCKPEPPKVEVPGTKDSTAKAENRAFAIGQYNIRAFMSGSPTPGGNFQIHVIASRNAAAQSAGSRAKFGGISVPAGGGAGRLRQGASDLREIVAIRQAQPWYYRIFTEGGNDDLLDAADTQDELADAVEGDGAATGRLLLKTVVLPMAAAAGSRGGRSTPVSAADRAKQIHSALDPRAQRSRTTAVTETAQGVRVVSSSERRLSPAQRALLKSNEVEGVGVGHAEVTGINAARQMGLTPTGTAASRGICSGCAGSMSEQNIEPLSPLK